MNRFVMKKLALIPIVFVVCIAAIVLWYAYRSEPKALEYYEQTSGEETAQAGETVVRDIALQNDFDGAKIAERELLQGCAGQDCIPSIDEPVFETAEQAGAWLDPEDRVFTIEYKGEFRAYPQRILNWHEIVNDTIAGDPIAITFCPLCGSAVAYEREVNGVITEFGVSGKLHNSDLVMYDRYEGNLWQQITGEAIVGPAARRDEYLAPVNIFTTTWAEWVAEHPETLVLSRETGFIRDYSAYPYGTYEEDDRLLFGVEGTDTTLQIKTVVYGVEAGGESKAYTEEALRRDGTIEDKLGGVPLLIEYTDADELYVTELLEGEDIPHVRLFWFAWAAFHPDTQLYQ